MALPSGVRLDIVLSVVMDEQNKEMNMAATENETMTTTFGMIRTIEGDAQVGWCLFVNNSASPTGRTELDTPSTLCGRRRSGVLAADQGAGGVCDEFDEPSRAAQGLACRRLCTRVEQIYWRGHH